MERAIWLVNNASSGSHGDEALAVLDAWCGDRRLRFAHWTVIPANARRGPSSR